MGARVYAFHSTQVCPFHRPLGLGRIEGGALSLPPKDVLHQRLQPLDGAPLEFWVRGHRTDIHLSREQRAFWRLLEGVAEHSPILRRHRTLAGAVELGNRPMELRRARGRADELVYFVAHLEGGLGHPTYGSGHLVPKRPKSSDRDHVENLGRGAVDDDVVLECLSSHDSFFFLGNWNRSPFDL